MDHEIKLSESIQLVDKGPLQRGKSNEGRERRGGDKGDNLDTAQSKKESATQKCKQETIAPMCPYGLHKARGYRQWLKNGNNCTGEEKFALFRLMADEKQRWDHAVLLVLK